MISATVNNRINCISDKMFRHVDGAIAFDSSPLTFTDAVSRAGEFFVTELCRNSDTRLSTKDGELTGNDTLPRIRQLVEQGMIEYFAYGPLQMRAAILRNLTAEMDMLKV